MWCTIYVYGVTVLDILIYIVLNTEITLPIERQRERSSNQLKFNVWYGDEQQTYVIFRKYTISVQFAILVTVFFNYCLFK